MFKFSGVPDYIIKSSAPIRICDLGGWTDTWFAKRGEVLNIAVNPRVNIQIRVYENPIEPAVVIHAKNYADRYRIQPGNLGRKHPLIEAAIDSISFPKNLGLEIEIYSDVPAGASTGTSASLIVALLAAMNDIISCNKSAYELAYDAWRVETEILQQQSGIQDQLAAAYGGLNLISIHNFPDATVTPLYLLNEVYLEFEKRLVLVFLGKTHKSNEIHQMVIHQLESVETESQVLQELTETALAGKEALLSGRLDLFGKRMVENNELQRALHPNLISKDADQVIRVAKDHEASGWKVNGAGGDGGSITLLMGEGDIHREKLVKDIQDINQKYKILPISIAKSGLLVQRISFLG